MPNCYTCGEVGEYHDGRERHCLWECIPRGECAFDAGSTPGPELTDADGNCYWAGENGHTDGWYLSHPLHDLTPPPLRVPENQMRLL